MTLQDKLELLKIRYNKLAQSPKNWKCPGVMRKVARQIRNLEAQKI
jgi:hypothetical protein